MYFIYELSFHGTEDIYIGCTKDTKQRFAGHKSARNWLKRGVIPKAMRLVKTTECLEEASDFELYLITLTWDFNLNSQKIGYQEIDVERRLNTRDDRMAKINSELTGRDKILKHFEDKAFKMIRQNSR